MNTNPTDTFSLSQKV
jgi:hypothetical protein